MDKIKFYDIVKKKKNGLVGSLNELTFPKIERCEVCGGARYIGKQRIDDPLLALKVALVKFGYSEFKSEQFHICHLIHDDERKDILDIFKNKTVNTIFCSSCGGTTGYYTENKNFNDKWTAVKVGLVIFGRSTAKRFDNKPSVFICNCEEVLKTLEEDLAKLPIENFGEWKLSKRTSRPRIGLRDYSRYIKTKRSFSKEELKTITEWLRRKDCPGWTGVLAKRAQDGYLFYTTWDSSG